MNLILSFFLIVFSASLTKLFIYLAQNYQLLDIPNERSMHSNPTVRGAGLIFISLSIIAMPFICYFTNTPLLAQSVFIASVTILASVSFFDDLLNLSSKFRFLIHFCLAAIIVMFINPNVVDLGWFSLSNKYMLFSFTVLTVVWAINHFNFMDGLDGFCAIQAIFLFTAYAIFFNITDGIVYQEFCLVLISCLMGFLIFNFPPAKVFMGDVGSATLGFITISLALLAQNLYDIPLLYWFILNSIFLVDSSLTLIRRVAQGEKWYEPHKTHAYQRLKQSGIQTSTILIYQTICNSIFFLLLLYFHLNGLDTTKLFISVMTFLLVIYFLIQKYYVAA